MDFGERKNKHHGAYKKLAEEADIYTTNRKDTRAKTVDTVRGKTKFSGEREEEKLNPDLVG